MGVDPNDHDDGVHHQNVGHHGQGYPQNEFPVQALRFRHFCKTSTEKIAGWSTAVVAPPQRQKLSILRSFPQVLIMMQTTKKKKTTQKRAKATWPARDQMQKLREELHQRLLCEDLENAWRLEAMDRVITLSQVDPVTFHLLWIEPLLAAGASYEVAIACVAASHLQPN